MKYIVSLAILAISSLASFARDIVPFTVNPTTNQMMVEVFVNNDPLPFNFCIDTGASAVFANLSNQRLMQLLNLCETDTVDHAFSSAQSMKTPFENSLMMGSLLADSIQIHAINDPSTTHDGVIGISLLSKYKFAILSDAGMLVFCTEDEPMKLPGAKECPMIEWQGVYGTSIEMKGDTIACSGNFMIDTGFGGTIAITSQFNEKHKLTDRFKVAGSLKAVDGAGSQSDTYLVTVPRTLLGGESLPLLPCQIDKDSSNSEYASALDGIVGYDILKRFNSIWDFKNKILYMAPNLDYFSPFTFIKRL